MTASEQQPIGQPRRSRGRPGHDREAVLRLAVQLFNERGYDATSIGDLAKHLGVTKSAIYHHFASKDSILETALNEALDGLAAVITAASTQDVGSTAIARLRTTIEESVRILAERLPAVTLLLRVRGNSPTERAALDRRRHIDEQLASLVEEAVAAHELRDDIEPELVSRLLFGMVNSLVEWWRPGGPLDADALAGTVTTVVFDGLKVRHASTTN